MSKKKELSHGDLIRSCKDIESRLKQSAKDMILAKFERGCLLHETVMADKQYGSSVMQTVAEELGYSDKTLYVEHAFAERFNFDVKKVKEKIAEAEKRDVKLSFAYFRKQLGEDSNPAVVGGLKNHQENLVAKIEDLGRAVSEGIEVQKQAEDNETQGAVVMGVEVLEEAAQYLLGDTLHPTPAKGLKRDLPHYRAWIRSQPSIRPGVGPIEAHHLTLKARGENSLDIFCVPLHKDLHDQFHKIGQQAFEQFHQVDLRLICLGFIQQYIAEHK